MTMMMTRMMMMQIIIIMSQVSHEYPRASELAGCRARCSACWLAGCCLLAGRLASRLLAGDLPGWLAGCQAGRHVLAGGLAAGRLLGSWLAGWLLAAGSSLAGELRKMAPCQKIDVRWKSQLHYHLMRIISQNQTLIHQEHFACCTSSYQHGFLDEKHVQRGPRYKKSRCPWDGVYLRTSIMFQTGGKPSTWFPPVGLVELYFPSNALS